MPLRRTNKIQRVKQQLVDRLRRGVYRPGDRFLSNRDAAEQFGISYQTAHRLIDELCREGRLERRPQSGTYVVDRVESFIGVHALFHRRAANERSFGSKMVTLLAERLEAERIDVRISLTSKPTQPAPDRLPIVWELPAVVADCARRKSRAVMIEDRPGAGLESQWIDSVSVDDFSGGACAAQLLRAHTGVGAGYVVVTGPKGDLRSDLRQRGFQSIVRSRTLRAGDWFVENGLRVAERAVRDGTIGVFCVCDSLAWGIVRWCRNHSVRCPPIIGFDDAPVAARINLTTISLPWEEMIDAVVRCAKRRLNGDHSTGSQLLLQPQLKLRGFAPSADDEDV